MISCRCFPLFFSARAAPLVPVHDLLRIVLCWPVLAFGWCLIGPDLRGRYSAFSDICAPFTLLFSLGLLSLFVAPLPPAAACVQVHHQQGSEGERGICPPSAPAAPAPASNIVSLQSELDSPLQTRIAHASKHAPARTAPPTDEASPISTAHDRAVARSKRDVYSRTNTLPPPVTPAGSEHEPATTKSAAHLRQLLEASRLESHEALHSKSPRADTLKSNDAACSVLPASLGAPPRTEKYICMHGRACMCLRVCESYRAACVHHLQVCTPVSKPLAGLLAPTRTIARARILCRVTPPRAREHC